MSERTQDLLSSFAVGRSLLSAVLLFATAGLCVASCSEHGGTDPSSSEPVSAKITPDTRPWKTDFRGDIAVILANQRVRQCDQFRYLVESSDPPAYLVQCLETGDQFYVVPESGEVTNTWKPGMPPPKPLIPPSRRDPSEARSRSSQADPDDMRQAREFLAGLPPACRRSYISVASDQTVIIHVACTRGAKSTQSQIRVKNGIVTDLR